MHTSSMEAYIRHGPKCPDGTWAALPFWLMLKPAQRDRLGELLGESADFDWAAAKRADPKWRPDLHTAKEEGLPLFLTANPGDCPPQGLLEGYTVYLLDFCYTEEALDCLVREVGPTGRIVVLDHHATNERVVAKFLERYPERVTAVFDMERSGSEIAWDFARDVCGFDAPRSRLMEYVGDQDTWKFALPESREVNATLRTEGISTSLGRAAAAYEREQKDPEWIKALAGTGVSILQAQAKIVDTITAASRVVYITARDPETGKTVEYQSRAVNAPTLQSEIGNAVADIPCDDGTLPAMAAVWYYAHAYDEIRVSLRTNRPDIDLSKITPTIVGVMGGGGHPRAAGCAIKGNDVKAVFRPHPLK